MVLLKAVVQQVGTPSAFWLRSVEDICPHLFESKKCMILVTSTTCQLLEKLFRGCQRILWCSLSNKFDQQASELWQVPEIP
ncbi:unnamed protein product [Sphagnum jensenii]|uniref:Uncharacterized protein n=1 Tax=Sphagnum jensenii TaxID=128206 RepID=A0ABP1A6N7_9BRYO